MNQPPPGSGTLHGWKDIAQHVRTSVRSAQRWEGTRGLPVRRITTPDGGQIVYATVGELDAWVAAASVEEPAQDSPAASAEPPATDGANVATADGAPGGTVATGGTDAPVTSHHLDVDRARRRSTAVAAAMVLVVLVFGSVIGRWLVTTGLPALATPSRYMVDGTAVVALTASGRQVWAWPLAQSASSPEAIRRGRQTWVADLDADGRSEVYVPVSRAPLGVVPQTTDELLVFDSTGTLRWTIAPTLRIEDGETTIDGPWRLGAVAVSTGQPGRLWVAYNHHTWHASFVLEVDARGTASIRYVYAGTIQALTHWRTADRDLLAIGGADFHEQGAALSVIDLAGPPARWPSAATTALVCDRCPTAPPEIVAVLPRSDVARARGRAVGLVMSMQVLPDGNLSAKVTGGGTGLPTETLAVLSPALTVTAIDRVEEYWTWHRAFESDGRLDHAADACPDASGTNVRLWSRGTWTVHQVPAAAHLRTALAAR